MMKHLLASVCLLALAGCSGEGISLPQATLRIISTSTPIVSSPTPQYVPISTPTPSLTLPPLITLTPTASSTFTPIPSSTAIPTLPPTLSLDIVGCNTSLDISHGMGEVTNAFVLIQNPGGADLVDVCATLSASDEARVHPDKRKCILSIPSAHQVTIKLTVDTGYEKDTSIQVDASASEGITAMVSRESCLAIGLPFGVPDDLNKVIPIP